jgi:MoaA/NifB/PqqE/SkfB family radical SAM enzyme
MSGQTLNQLLSEASECYRLNLTEKAESLYREALQINPKQAIALFNLGTILLRKSNLQGDQLVKDSFENDSAGEIDLNRAVELVIQIHLSNSYKKHAEQWLRYAEINQLRFPSLVDLRRAIKIPAHIQKTIYSPKQNKSLERYHPIESSSYVYAIDVVGGCNLRCPTCPVGNQKEMPKGIMSLELFSKVLEKIRAENPIYKPDIWLFNWSEPLLNPHLPEFIKKIHEAELTSFISSNLNISDRIDAVMKSNPNRFKVSISSLQQEIYGVTHDRGDIQTVINNFENLAKARDKYNSTTEIWIGHHLYKNTIREMEQVSALASRYGFGYRPSYAIMAPIEKAYFLLKNVNPIKSEIEDQLFFHPKTIAENIKPRRSGSMDCELRFNMTAINYDGSVSLCCGTTKNLSDEIDKKIIFLEHNHSEIENFKYNHSFCSTCMENDLHLTIQDL